MAFTVREREDIESDWGYFTVRGRPIVDERPLTRGHITSNPLTPADFLLVVTHRMSDRNVKRRNIAKVRELRGGDLPGSIHGKRYTNVMHVMQQAKQLIQAGKLEQVDAVVDKAFTAYEEESRIGLSLTAYDEVPLAPYWDFAVFYHNQKDYAREVRILERLVAPPHRSGHALEKFFERLEKARALVAQVSANG